jgi:hypothetical protein
VATIVILGYRAINYEKWPTKGCFPAWLSLAGNSFEF